MSQNEADPDALYVQREDLGLVREGETVLKFPSQGR